MKHSTMRKNITLMAAATLLAGLTACGGGGGSDNKPPSNSPNTPNIPGGPNFTDNIPTTTSLPELQGLNNDADQHYRLFYVDASRTTTVGTGIFEQQVPDFRLKSYDPITETKQTVSEDIPFASVASPSLFPAALRKAAVDAQTGKITGFEIASVAYMTGSDDFISNPNYQAMVTDVNTGTSKKVGKAATDLRIGMNPIISMDLNSPEKALYTAAYNENYLLRMDDPETKALTKFPADVHVRVPLHFTTGAKAGSPLGWLVIDENQESCLALVEKTDVTQATCIPNTDGSSKVKLQRLGAANQYLTGFYSLNDGVVLSIPVEASQTGLQTTSELWFYKAGSPGSLQLIKNGQGETLNTTSVSMFGPSQNNFVVSKNGDTLYVADTDGGFMNILASGGQLGTFDPTSLESHVYLFKVSVNAGNASWQQLYHDGGKYFSANLGDKEAVDLGSFLADAGNRLLWVLNEKLISIDLNGQNLQTLDGRDGDEYQAISMVTSNTNWFYYNQELGQHDYATAVKTDGSARVELKNCSWIGASTSGTAKYVGGSLTSLEPSEMFMQCNQQEISALDANNPKAGRVILGSLTKKAESINMQQTPAPGPHRLLRAEYEQAGENIYHNGFEVLYVNTRQEGSLKSLVMAEGVDGDENKAEFTMPVKGF